MTVGQRNQPFPRLRTTHTPSLSEGHQCRSLSFLIKPPFRDSWLSIYYLPALQSWPLRLTCVNFLDQAPTLPPSITGEDKTRKPLNMGFIATDMSKFNLLSCSSTNCPLWHFNSLPDLTRHLPPIEAQRQPWKNFAQVSEQESYDKHQMYLRTSGGKPWNEWLRDYAGIVATPRTPAPPPPPESNL